MDSGEDIEKTGKVPTKVRVLLTASFFSALATVGQITIVGKQVYDMTGSELNLGLLGLAEFLPVALLSPFTGPVADRFDRRRVFSLALIAQAIASLLLFLYIDSDPEGVFPIFALITVFGVEELSQCRLAELYPLTGLQMMWWSAL